MTQTTSWYERHPRLTMTAVYALILVCAELLVRAAAAAGYIPIGNFPTTDATKRFYGDNNEHFGVWHYPNRETHHFAPCYDAIYQSNSYGARDKERSRHSDAARRAVVLGDSFVEGIGVNAEQRMTDLVEAATGIEQLNFGTSGDFSSTQEWLLYRELASKFDHSDVLLFHLPANDFRDNNPSNFSPGRYRPYLRETDSGNLELFYTVDFEHRDKPKGFSTARAVRRTLYNNIYLLNVIRRSAQIYNKNSVATESESSGELQSTYDRFSDLDLKRLLFGYENIAELAPDKRFTIFIIPRQSDFDKLHKAGYDFRIVKELQKFAAQHSNVEVVDLLPHLQAYADRHKIDIDDLYLACDGHWTAQGNQAAAEAVVEAVYNSAE
ncbi:MAG: SGNH/GDSL hydrolase family protein [Bdellovibrionales bacterium]|nr:SGNH/GDSL hydrolase family protein [Bdellovibrionales bacterium]